MNNINFQELFSLMFKNDFRYLSDSVIYKEDNISIYASTGYNGRGNSIEYNIKNNVSDITIWFERQKEEFLNVNNEDVVSLIGETLLKFKKIDTNLDLSDI